jgi:hypothetical protein
MMPLNGLYLIKNKLRTAESAGGGQNFEIKNICLFLLKTSAVRNSLFDIRYSIKAKVKGSHRGLPYLLTGANQE